MENLDRRQLGVKKNKLLRYKAIKELYQEKIKQFPHTPLTQILKNYIYPVYPISRTTLYEVLSTSITRQLQEIEDYERSLANH